MRLLAVACLGLMTLAQRGVTQQTTRVDSVVIERLVPYVPSRIPITKRRALTVHPQLDSALSRLRSSRLGLFESAPTPVCRSDGTDVGAVVVTIFADANHLRMTIPDNCVASSEALTTRVKDLQSLAWRMIRQGE